MDHRLSFQRKASSINGFDAFFSLFPNKFLVFACFYCCFYSHKTYCDVLLITYAWWTSLSSHQGISERIFWLSLKSVEFNDCWVLKKNFFEKLFWTLNILKLFFKLLVSFFFDRTPFLSTATKNNLINGFLFFLLVLRLPYQEFS